MPLAPLPAAPRRRAARRVCRGRGLAERDVQLTGPSRAATRAATSRPRSPPPTPGAASSACRLHPSAAPASSISPASPSRGPAFRGRQRYTRPSSRSSSSACGGLFRLARWFGGTGTIWWQAPWLTAVGTAFAIGLIPPSSSARGSPPLAGGDHLPRSSTPDRSTYSEPLAMVTPRCRPARARPRRARRSAGDGGTACALVSGLLVGGTALVRIDGLRETILPHPVAALAAVRGARWPRPALTGAAVGTAVALAAGWALSLSLTSATSRRAWSPPPRSTVAFTIASVRVVIAGRRGIALPGALRRGLPWAVRVGVVALGLLLTARPGS